MPSHITKAMATTPMIVDTPIGAFLRYTKKPKKIARTMNSSEMIAVVALAAEAATSTAPST